MRRGVEIGEIAAADIDRSDGETHFAGIDAVEIDEPRERRLQRSIVIIARFVRAAGRPQHRRRQTGHEKVGCAEQEDIHGAGLIDELMVLLVLQFDMFEIGDTERRRTHGLPKLAQARDTLLGRIAGDDRRIDRADRNPAHPVWLHAAFVQRLVHAGLVGAQRAATLQHQRHPVAMFGPPAWRCGNV
jgi:hypothetical protein